MQGINIVGVQFRRAGRVYDFSSDAIELSIGDFVIVDSERGPSLAEVVTIRFHHPSVKLPRKLKPILRRASEGELANSKRLTTESVTEFTNELVRRHKLKMKVLQSEVQFGGGKVIVYFTAPGRVDFRDLVKSLARGLKTRIELKQVGSRDETKLLGGIGICGREYCCSSFLREFVPISIRMAKNQNLALNPSKVSGGCGRLLCCLTYENKTYTKLRQKLPPKGSRVRLLDYGIEGKVTRVDLLNQTVAVSGLDQKEITVKVDDIELLGNSLPVQDLENQEPEINARDSEFPSGNIDGDEWENQVEGDLSLAKEDSFSLLDDVPISDEGMTASKDSRSKEKSKISDQDQSKKDSRGTRSGRVDLRKQLGISEKRRSQAGQKGSRRTDSSEDSQGNNGPKKPQRGRGLAKGPKNTEPGDRFEEQSRARDTSTRGDHSRTSTNGRKKLKSGVKSNHGFPQRKRITRGNSPEEKDKSWHKGSGGFNHFGGRGKEVKTERQQNRKKRSYVKDKG